MINNRVIDNAAVAIARTSLLEATLAEALVPATSQERESAE